MATLNMTNDEPLKLVHLVEQLLPGTDLTAAKKALAGVSFAGTHFVAKKTTAPNESITFEVIVGA